MNKAFVMLVLVTTAAKAASAHVGAVLLSHVETDIHAKRKLYNKAAAALAASLDKQIEPAMAVRLGDPYLGLGLLGLLGGAP